LEIAIKRMMLGVISVAALVISAACSEKPEIRHCVGADCFDWVTFADRIQDRLNGNVVGYQLAVNYKGIHARRAGWGLSRTAADAPATAMTVNQRLNLASVNKTFTAVAVLRALAAKKMTVDVKISPYLPGTWTLGPGVDTVTFRELLTHKSGFRNETCGATFLEGYESLKNGVAQGLVSKNGVWFKNYCYQNGNFALFRVILPYLTGAFKTTDAITPDSLAESYLAILNKEVIEPSGIATKAQCKPNPSPAPVLFYPFPAGTTKGWDFGDWTQTCGSGGLHLSGAEVALFLHHLSRTEDLLSTTQRMSMYGGLLGWEEGWSKIAVKHGTYHSHGGYLSYPVSAVAKPGMCTTGSVGEDNTVVMDFSIGVQVALLINSQVSNLGCAPRLQNLVVAAYDESWEPK
jgi:CubicO group peptidase (beta-lactamase class C family)